MPSKYLLPLALLISNLALYYLMTILQAEPDLYLFLRITRVIFITSVIMQSLMAIGLVKPPQFK